jgi:hypothetical protein
MNRHQRRASEALSRRGEAAALSQLSAMARRASSTDSFEERSGVLCGWSFVLSKNIHGDRAPDGSDWYIVSARLQPIGRGSTSEDWRFLGTAIATLGAPPAPVTPLETTDPNDAHYWTWSSSGHDVAEILRHQLTHRHEPWFQKLVSNLVSRGSRP